MFVSSDSVGGLPTVHEWVEALSAVVTSPKELVQSSQHTLWNGNITIMTGQVNVPYCEYI